MCGICGFSGQPDERLIKKMTDTLEHRGPDDEGFYVGDGINLGMRRLSIIDLTGGRQPISNEDKTVWVVFNGEIFNYLELKDDLEKKGHIFSTKSDTETIVHLYEEYGLDFPVRLNGMFAIAIWDCRLGKLILVRDQIGIKPLYYFFGGGNFIFGSEIKAILAHPGYKKEIEIESLHHYLSLKHTPAPKTMFKGIFSLVPGELISISNNKIKKEKYWDFEYKENNEIEEKEAAQKIIKLLSDSVRLRMRSDVTVGAYLSGGLDSSLVLALMSECTKKPINTFCLGYEEKFENKLDDLNAAREISKLYKTCHHEYIMSWKEIPEGIDDVIGAFDEPFAAVTSTFFISRLIKKYVKVALSGDGGDELFGSYLSHRLASPLESFQASGFDEAALKDIGLSLNDEKILRRFKKMKPWQWRSQLSVFSEMEKKVFYSKKFKTRIRGFDTGKLWRGYFAAGTSRDALNKVLEAEFKGVFPDQVLSYSDKLSMAHSIELRPPFLDTRLVEFAATIPGSLKIKRGSVKYVLKQAAQGYLPAHIINRPKEGFILPLNYWLFKNMRGFVEEALLSKRLKAHGLFDPNIVKRLLGCYYSSSQPAFSSEEFTRMSNKIWELVVFQRWWEKYFL
ncbi:MAG: asparagine synthase (glutamine-hydrolyzing) [Candidatus Portnoybacteria bacterium]|nr:asparagine synthase (glutamine-hydrolyzing) [Candidatus Portnoybacteria bacterium]MDD4982477.1 asparagine synthase (glutamine-hydrolyzing) [Candidatus Portnoybacteria bacterium]